MKRTCGFMPFIGLVLGIVLLFVPRLVSAEVTKFQFRSELASAQFVMTDPSGCMTTEVFVTPGEFVTKNPPGPPVEVSHTGVAIIIFDQCTSTELLVAFGSADLREQDFHVSHSTSRADLQGTVNVCDFVSNTCFDVTVKMLWIGSGSPERGKHKLHVKFPNFKFFLRSQGVFDDAVATGTVTDGTANYTPSPSVLGFLGVATTAEMEIHKP